MTIDWEDLLKQREINLADILLKRHVREGNDMRRAICYEDRSYSYRELIFETGRRANVLRMSGVKQGDRVLLVVPDNPSFVTSFFAILAVGGVAVLANPQLPGADLGYMSSHVGAKLAIVYHGIADKMTGLITTGTKILLCGDGHMDIGELDLAAAEQQADFDIVSTAASDLAYVLFSSGTTGNPKAIPRRHVDILYCARAYADEVINLCADDLVVAVPKLTFGYALGGALLFSMLFGAAAVIFPQRTTAQVLFELFERFRPSIFLGSPRIIAELLNSRQAAMLRDLRIATSAGESLPPSVFEQWRQDVNVPLLDGFGSTEAGHIFLSNFPQNIVSGSCGKCLSTFQVKLIDNQGHLVEEGQVGRMCIAGPSVADQYLNDSERSAEAFDGPWHISKDLFVYHDGVYSYVGRADDMIKKGCGEWVSPYEVEDELLKLSFVLECAVVGSQSSSGVITLKAYVACKHDTPISEKLALALIDHTRQRWPDFPHKHLDQVEFIESLPRTNSGKIQRHLLRQQTLTEFSYDC
ncbi:AMP-binding protein [Methylobacter sp.]|jgi:benzoate-CoA ligase family protein|uniref:AMP-binding protein n=1 Tax=Methylobacter sp. TaxID=2051955 RepID=UPI003DA49C8A